MEKGILYICATPIGNLEDMTYRAVRILGEVDLIAAEDTRNSIKLLNHFEISTPMTSYHEHNKYDKADELVKKLSEGVNIALISDAGTPGISDPGEILVSQAIEAGIRVVPIPGACAGINALVVSGQITRRFVFEGFLPVNKKERRSKLSELRSEKRTIILHEAPHHLKGTLKELLEALGDRSVSVCRELTKLHEEVRKTTLSEALYYYESNEPKGEFILVIAGESGESESDAPEAAESLPVTDDLIRERVEMYEEKGNPRKEAMRLCARDLGLSRRDVYNRLVRKI